MIVFNQKQCIGCGQCVNDCVSYCITLENGFAALKDDFRHCIHCGHCVAVCPVGAVSIEEPGYDMTESETLTTIHTKPDPQQILQTLKFRRSTRQYLKKSIEQSILDDLMEAARYTATGANSQRFRFVIVQDEMDTFHEMAWQHFDRYVQGIPDNSPQSKSGIIERARLPKDHPLHDTLFWGAPCLIIIAADHGGIWDAGLASQSIEFAALSHNLGTLYSGYLVGLINKCDTLKEWLGIPDCEAKTCILTGYPAVTYHRSAPRKPTHIIWK